jgi:histidinol-phosphate/aromatic aminotransferase/cobyric acid decarboxylase-like protein
MDLYDAAEGKKCSIRQVYDFTTGVNPLGPSGKARHGARKVIKRLDLFPDERNRYLRRLICREEGLSEEQVVFGNGSTGLLDGLLELVKPSLVAVLAPLSFRRVSLLERRGITIRPYPLRLSAKGTPSLEELMAQMDDADMIMIPNPHDVLGTVMPADDLEGLVSLAANRNKVVVIDEAYRGYVDLPSPLRRVVDARQAVIVRTFSLFHGLAGLRIGYAMGHEVVISRLSETLGPCSLNAVASEGALASLKEKGQRARTDRFIAGEKAYFLKALHGVAGVECVDTACNFLLLKTGTEPGRLAEGFRNRNILIHEYLDEEGHPFIWLPVKSRRLNALFVRGLRSLLRVRGQSW